MEERECGIFRDAGMRRKGLSYAHDDASEQFAAIRGALKSLAETLAPQLDGRLAPWNARMFLFALLPGLDRQQPAPYASRSVGRPGMSIQIPRTRRRPS